MRSITMLKRIRTLTAVALAGVLFGLMANQMVGAQSSGDEEPVVIEPLTQHALSTADGREAVMLRATFAPGAEMAAEPTIAHPAEEFVYVLEGTAVLTLQGEEPVRYEAGESWYNELRQAHTLRNGSAEEPMVVLAIWIGEEGELMGD
ncbi:MAG: cupin domain-containing protein [Trueperaceae bacterium]|nr:cupin domain-containing protein [Trueperaceae bacterium]